MKYIKTFNESRADIDLNIMIQKIASEIDIKKLRKLLKPYNNTLSKLFDKYSKNGIVDVNLIYKSIGMNESLSFSIMSLLKLPLKIVTSIINMCRNIFSNRVLSMKIFFIALFVVVLSFSVYQTVEHSMNGIFKGIINEVEFVPEHIETTEHSYTDSEGKTETYYTDEVIPDTWNAEVRGNNGRIEKWTTIDPKIGKEADEDEIISIENWSWVNTIKYGKKTGGQYSGSGSGGDF